MPETFLEKQTDTEHAPNDIYHWRIDIIKCIESTGGQYYKYGCHAKKFIFPRVQPESKIKDKQIYKVIKKVIYNINHHIILRNDPALFAVAMLIHGLQFLLHSLFSN